MKRTGKRGTKQKSAPPLRDAEARLEFEVSQQTKELEAEVTHLREASHAKDEFIRITNHELRTPLDVIRGNIDMVLKGETGEISARTKEYLADALLGADRLTKLVNDMLDISRVETGRMKFFLENIELVKFLKTIHTEFVPLAEKRNLKLYLTCPRDLPAVFSDRGRIFQAIDNFLGNSLKFTPEGGSVTISAKTEDSMVVVSVRDTGTGIREEDQKKLFKRFPQIETPMIDGVKGTGLGLYLTRHIIEKLGGRIWAESPGLGKGTTFSFALPRAGTSAAESLRSLYQSDAPTNAS
jgi:signal transduction histidine kinase